MAMMLAFHDALRRELGHIARVAACQDRRPPSGNGDVLRAGRCSSPTSMCTTAARTTCSGPSMEKTLADSPDDLALLAAMEAEHAAIDPLLNAIDATLANPASPPERLGDLTDALARTLHAHLAPRRGRGPAAHRRDGR